MMMVSTVNYYVKTMMNGATVDCHLQQRMGWNLHASIVALLLWRGGGVCCHGWLLLSSPSTTSSSRCVLPHYCSYSADLFSAGFRAKPCRHVQLYAAPTVEINSNNNNNDPNLAQKLVFQGMEAFRMGRIDESIQWFDQAQALRPTLLPYLWQRGISYYYAGKYAEASRQFRTDVQVNPLDVEEIVWDIAAQSQQQKTKNGQNSIQMMALPQGKTDRRKIMVRVCHFVTDDSFRLILVHLRISNAGLLP